MWVEAAEGGAEERGLVAALLADLVAQYSEHIHVLPVLAAPAHP